MKRKFKILIFVFLISISFIGNSISSEHNDCDTFLESLKSTEYKMVPINFWENFGFRFAEKFDSELRDWTTITKDGYYLVGKVFDPILAQEVKTGDKIISLNGKKFEWSHEQAELLENESVLTFKFLNKENKFIEKKLEKYEYEAYSPVLDIESLNFNKIDTKNGVIEVNIEYDVSAIYDAESHPDLWKAVTDNIVYKEKDTEEYTYYICTYNEDEFEKTQIPKPFHGFKIVDLVKKDKNLFLEKVFKFTPYSTKVDNRNDELMVEEIMAGYYVIKNNFNLKTFPFDRQIIKIKIIDDFQRIPNTVLFESGLVYDAMNAVLKKNDIPGWNIESFEFNYFQYQSAYHMEQDFSDGLELILDIERKHSYYLYKVILPILLILSVCWLVVWIDPRELEARLTVTIVCLLSLIAYNFVIDSELPKLEYLTVLDWIILTSYVYAVIPNILSVISFRLLKTNKKLGDKIEFISTRYGALSYLVIIFIIIVVNANLNVENSTALISWTTFK
tara:strand:- start:1480 stop:2991 length:1512 start_codon:yes stop_codon:yes gene_type:complete